MQTDFLSAKIIPMTSAEKIAKILRADKDTVINIEKAMAEIVGHNNVLEKIDEDNKRTIEEKLGILCPKSNHSYDIYSALLDKIEQDDTHLSEALGSPVCNSQEGCAGLISAVKKVAGHKKGFFLKTEKAKELFAAEPPLNVVKTLGYRNVNELLENEDIFEVFSAIRFIEDADWLNNVFFKQYENLSPDDFEEREIGMMVLSQRWKDVAEKFLKKKYHNISHLKELGLIFILPAVLGINGETLRTIGLLLHYFNEILFYSNLFRKYAKGDDFSQKLIASLRGDVLDERLGQKKWMIVQRYLAKDDENDWRLLEPHVNPEAMHWKKAENAIGRLGGIVDSVDLSFWKDVDCVGDFYQSKGGTEQLVSFNLVDTVMALVKRKEMIKYLYHHQEALWNKIFYGFVGEEKMEQLIIDNFEKGFIELT